MFKKLALLGLGALLPLLAGAAPELRIYERTLQENKEKDFDTANREHWTAALAEEKGTLSLYSTSPLADGTRVLFIEIYASPAAYQAHLRQPAQQRYSERAPEFLDESQKQSYELVPVILAERPMPLSVLQRQKSAFLSLEKFTLKPDSRPEQVIGYMKSKVWALQNRLRAVYGAQDARDPRTFYYVRIGEEPLHADDALRLIASSYEFIPLRNRVLLSRGGLTYLRP